MATEALPDHPAKFHPRILAELATMLDRWGPPQTDAKPITMVLDPFAGTGRIHQLAGMGPHPGRWATLGYELEPEWAAYHPDTWAGDALNLPLTTGSIPAIATSPCYGNRMADHHQARDACKGCGGSGCRADQLAIMNDDPPWCLGAHPDVPPAELADSPHLVDHGLCNRCGGKGMSKRYTYAHQLGRDPSAGSAAVLGWGRDYRDFHELFIREAIRVLAEGDHTTGDGLLLVNMGNHPKGGAEQLVVEWWVNALLCAGCSLLEVVHVPTPGNGDGANHTEKIDGEKIIAVRTPTPRRML